MILTFYNPIINWTVKNIVGNQENAGSQHFLLLYNVFYPIKDINYHFPCILIVVCNLNQSKVLSVDRVNPSGFKFNTRKLTKCGLNLRMRVEK